MLGTEVVPNYFHSFILRMCQICSTSYLKIYIYLSVLVVLDLSCGFQNLVAACRMVSCSVQTLSWGLWNLVPQPGIEPRPPKLGVQSLNHWTTREVPTSHFLMVISK